MMKNSSNKSLGGILTALGIGLISLAVLLVVLGQVMDGVWSNKAEKILKEML